MFLALAGLAEQCVFLTWSFGTRNTPSQFFLSLIQQEIQGLLSRVLGLQLACMPEGGSFWISLHDSHLAR